jgi:chromosome segregation ATPase
MADLDDLLIKIGDISVQLGTFIYKTNDLKEQIKSVCDAAAKQTERTQELAEEIAILKTKIEFSEKACSDLSKKVENVQEFTWKQAGFIGGISFAVSVITFLIGLGVLKATGI